MKNEKERFYESETPELVQLKGGEVRLYRECGRLSLSKNPWTDENGVERIGKTVSINLKANAGDKALISVLRSCIDMLNK